MSSVLVNVSSLSLTSRPMSYRGYVTSLKLSPNLRKVPKVSQEIHQVSHGCSCGGLVTSILEGCQYTRGISTLEGCYCQYIRGVSTLEGCYCQYISGVNTLEGCYCQYIRGVNTLEGCYSQYIRGVSTLEECYCQYISGVNTLEGCYCQYIRGCRYIWLGVLIH